MKWKREYATLKCKFVILKTIFLFSYPYHSELAFPPTECNVEWDEQCRQHIGKSFEVFCELGLQPALMQMDELMKLRKINNNVLKNLFDLCHTKYCIILNFIWIRLVLSVAYIIKMDGTVSPWWSGSNFYRCAIMKSKYKL